MVEQLRSRNIRASKESQRATLIQEVAREVRANENAVDILDEVACERLGTNRTDARVIDILDARGGRLTAGKVAAATGLSPGAMTAAIDRLERMGAVRRVGDPADRRRVLVELTDEARRKSYEIYGPVAEFGHKGLAACTDEELEFLLRFLRGGNEWLNAYATRLREEMPASGPSFRRGRGRTPRNEGRVGGGQGREGGTQGRLPPAEGCGEGALQELKSQAKATKAEAKKLLGRRRPG
jgi:DNA-binding MarR family transcriptional regulator